MKAINVDDVLRILHKYGKYIFVTDEKKYSSMIDEIANLKALEQEPFMNKPCVASQVCHEDKVKVLDKIRAEIEEVELNITYKENHKVGGTWGLRKALEIIDKYMAETEQSGNPDRLEEGE